MQYIIADFNANTRKLDDGAECLVPNTVCLKIDTKNNSVELLEIKGVISDRRRALLGGAVANAAKKVNCPKELYDRGITGFEFSFTVSLHPN